MSEQTEAVDIKKLIERSGLRVGTNVKTKFMKSFITKTTDEGLYMLDGDMTLEKIMTAAKFINRVGAENIIVCSGRQYAGIPIEKFCEMTGAKHHLRRFMPGTLTNPSLPYYIEPKIVFISDPEVDEQALIEATNAGIPVIGLSNTENITSKLDIIIPANNRGRRALATMYWLLVRQILIEKGELKENESMKYEIEDFESKHTEEEIE
ncbi:30S ribosomal protein S2 [Nitrosopumilus sp.]|nr:30S ribosomal protein S2 [Nitrosopumilus sp.]